MSKHDVNGSRVSVLVNSGFWQENESLLWFMPVDYLGMKISVRLFNLAFRIL